MYSIIVVLFDSTLQDYDYYVISILYHRDSWYVLQFHGIYIPSQNVKNHRPQISAGHFHPLLCDLKVQSRQQFARDRNLYDADITCIKRGQFEVSAIKISTHFHLFCATMPMCASEIACALIKFEQAAK